MSTPPYFKLFALEVFTSAFHILLKISCFSLWISRSSTADQLKWAMLFLWVTTQFDSLANENCKTPRDRNWFQGSPHPFILMKSEVNQYLNITLPLSDVNLKVGYSVEQTLLRFSQQSTAQRLQRHPGNGFSKVGWCGCALSTFIYQPCVRNGGP